MSRVCPTFQTRQRRGGGEMSSMLPWWGNRSFDFWFFWSDKYNTVILCFKVFFTPFLCYFTHFQRALQLFIQFELIWFDIALFFRKIWILQKFGQILSKADQYWTRPSFNYAKDWLDHSFLFPGLVWSEKRVSLWMWPLGGSSNHFPVYWAIFGMVT